MYNILFSDVETKWRNRKLWRSVWWPWPWRSAGTKQGESGPLVVEYGYRPMTATNQNETRRWLVECNARKFRRAEREGYIFLRRRVFFGSVGISKLGTLISSRLNSRLRVETHTLLVWSSCRLDKRVTLKVLPTGRKETSRMTWHSFDGTHLMAHGIVAEIGETTRLFCAFRKSSPAQDTLYYGNFVYASLYDRCMWPIYNVWWR